MTEAEKARRRVQTAQMELPADPGKLIAHAIAGDIFDRTGMKRIFEGVEQHVLEEMYENWAMIANVVIQEKVLGGPPIDA